MGMIANTQLKAARGPLLLDWRPEDPEFWARNGKRTPAATCGSRSPRCCSPSPCG